MSGLTHKQADLISFVQEYQRESGGASPSYQQIEDALGLKSKSGVYALIDRLEARGKVRRLPGQARTIEIVGV